MAWERGYYYRVRKVRGRVVREYVGTGPHDELAAQTDAAKRQKREMTRAARRAKRDELDALDASLNELNEMADLLARAALVAAGFRQHKRGEWRKRRGNYCPDEHDRPDRPRGTAQAPGPGPEGR